MPAHKLHGPALSPTRPKSQRVKKRSKFAPQVSSPGPSHARASSSAHLLDARSSSPEGVRKDDLFVTLSVGDYTTQMGVATLHSVPSALTRAYALAFASNQRTPEGRIAMSLSGDGNSFRLVEAFMHTGRLPPAIGAEQLAYLQQSAWALQMPQLTHEAHTLYPMREELRDRTPKTIKQSCTYIADILMYAAALVQVPGAHEEVDDFFESLPGIEPQPDDATWAQAALTEHELRRSSLMFAYLSLKRMGCNSRLSYFKAVVQSSATGFFIYGDLGEQLARAGRSDLSGVFLRKVMNLTGSLPMLFTAQKIRTTLLSTDNVSDPAIDALEAQQDAAANGSICATLGRALMLRRNWDVGANMLLRSLSRGLPEAMRSRTHHALGECYRAQQRMQDALSQYRKAYEHAPYDPVMSAAVGATLYALGRHREAAEWRHLVVQLDPHSVHAQRLLGVSLLAQGHIKEALARFDMAEVIDNEDIKTLQCKVAVGERLGDWQFAIANQRKIIAVSFYTTHDWRKLAYLYNKAEQPIAAHGALQHSVRLEEASARIARAHNTLAPTLIAPCPATPPPHQSPEPIAEAITTPGSPAPLHLFGGNDYLLFDLPELALKHTQGPSEEPPASWWSSP